MMRRGGGNGKEKASVVVAAPTTSLLAVIPQLLEPERGCTITIDQRAAGETTRDRTISKEMKPAYEH